MCILIFLVGDVKPKNYITVWVFDDIFCYWIATESWRLLRTKYMVYVVFGKVIITGEMLPKFLNFFLLK